MVRSALLPLATLAALAVSFPAPASTFTVDAGKSQMRWHATKVTGEHNGTVPVKTGAFEMQGDEITKGRLEIDLTKLIDLDLQDPKYNSDLTNHLKSDDFFSAVKFPAIFEFTKATKTDAGKYQLAGKLTMKGKTQPVDFPVTLKKEGDLFKLSGKATLDRTRWDIRYRSGKYFPNIGDKLIHDKFDVEFDVMAAASVPKKQ